LGVAQPEAAEGTPAPATEVLKWLKQADEHTAMLPALACTSYSFEHVPSQATAAPGAIRPAPEAGGPAQTSPTGEPQS
jgi:hypothetical protein